MPRGPLECPYGGQERVNGGAWVLVLVWIRAGSASRSSPRRGGGGGGELADILQDLVDEQEGPPLLRHQKRWQAVMDRAHAALSAYAAARSKEPAP